MCSVSAHFVKVSSLIICALFFALSSNAQEAVQVKLVDGITQEPIEKVQLITKGANILYSDKNGVLGIPNSLIINNSYFLLYKEGYQPDTLKTSKLPEELYLYPLQRLLGEAVITSKKSHIVLKRGREYMFDYAFVGDNILIASRSGKGHKLSLVDNNGHVLMENKDALSFKELYKSSVGVLYLVTSYGIHRITFDHATKEIKIGEQQSLRTLAQLKDCVLYNNDVYYYKFVDKELHSISFRLSRRGDTQLVSFRESWQKEDLFDIVDGKSQVQQYVAQGNLQAAKMLSNVIELTDKNSFKRINTPLFLRKEALLIFDFDNGYLNFYSLNGVFLKRCPLQFDYDDLRIKEIMQDAITGKIYAYRVKQEHQILLEIDVEKGSFSKQGVRLEKPFAQKVTVRGGNIYYLWSNERQKGKQQLYIQTNSIK
ncbi:MAG: hypothetical protein R2800_12535 [Flavipsychrobacter sp.]